MMDSTDKTETILLCYVPLKAERIEKNVLPSVAPLCLVCNIPVLSLICRDPRDWESCITYNKSDGRLSEAEI